MSSEPGPGAHEEDSTNQSSEALSAVSQNVEGLTGQTSKFKKVSSHRRKKERLRRKREQAKLALEAIIQNMYALKTCFDREIQAINDLLEVDRDEDRFYEFINKIIREQVDLLAKSIHTKTEGLCELYEQKGCVDRVEVARLYQLIQKVQEASLEVEEIINLFIRKVEQVYDEDYLHHHLDLSTLKYIFDSNPAKGRFQNFCLAYIQESTDLQERNTLELILKTMRTADLFDDTNDEEDSFEYQDEPEAEGESEGQEKRKKRRKKNRNRKKQRKLQEQLEKQTGIANAVIKSFAELRIWDEERSWCCVDESWLSSLQIKFKQKLSNPPL